MPEDKEQTALALNGKKQNIRRKDFFVFAEECGISKSELRKLEEGATHISLDTLLVLARHLGLIVFLSLIAAFYKTSIHEIIAFKNEAICKEILHALVLFLAGDLVAFLENEQQDNDHHCHNK